VTDPANGTFFGFQNPGGIGSVVFGITSQGPLFDNYSPYIDNLSFGAVPEPSTPALVLVAFGVIALRYVRRR
jgi:hypothetical protein